MGDTAAVPHPAPHTGWNAHACKHTKTMQEEPTGTLAHTDTGTKKYKHAITKAFSSASPLSHSHDHRQKAELLNPPTLHAAADQPVFLSPTPLTLAVKAL